MSRLDNWLDKIGSSHPVKWDLGLERVRQVAERLDVLCPAGLVFLVAGTNGKGSTCTIIARYLEEMGLRTGLSMSPHLHAFNERIHIGAGPATDEMIVHAFEKIEYLRKEISLTYFEYSALAALLIFKQQQMDACVLEVGLGGRLDAMNIVEPDVAVVTRIALDHQEWLGDTREKIAKEKAGIFRSGIPVVIGSDEAPALLRSEAECLGARVFARGSEFTADSGELSWDFRGLSLSGREKKFTALPLPSLPLDSHATAIQALLCAGIEPGLQILRNCKITLAGRFQIVEGDVKTIFDVCHNPDAAAYLVSRIEKLGLKGKLSVVLGIYKDKDYGSVIETLSRLVDDWYFTDLTDARGERGVSLKACLWDRLKIESASYDKVALAYQAALAHSRPGDAVVVCGSFETVGELQRVHRGQGERGPEETGGKKIRG